MNPIQSLRDYLHSLICRTVDYLAPREPEYYRSLAEKAVEGLNQWHYSARCRMPLKAAVTRIYKDAKFDGMERLCSKKGATIFKERAKELLTENLKEWKPNYN